MRVAIHATHDTAWSCAVLTMPPYILAFATAGPGPHLVLFSFDEWRKKLTELHPVTTDEIGFHGGARGGDQCSSKPIRTGTRPAAWHPLAGAPCRRGGQPRRPSRLASGPANHGEMVPLPRKQARPLFQKPGRDTVEATGKRPPLRERNLLVPRWAGRAGRPHRQPVTHGCLSILQGAPAAPRPYPRWAERSRARRDAHCSSALAPTPSC